MRTPTVYILRCRTGKFYTGVTSDLDARLWRHDQGIGSDFTRKNGPCELAWAGRFERMEDAIGFEKRIKGWRRAKKLAIIEGRWEELPELAAAYVRKRGTEGAPDRLLRRGSG